MQPAPPADALAQAYLLALLSVEGVGTITAKHLVAHAGSAQNVFGMGADRLLKIPGIGVKIMQAIQSAAATLKPRFDEAEREFAFCHKHDIRLRTYLDADFPAYLKTELSHPAVLFQKGPLDLNTLPAVAIVGTRTPTDYGRRQAARFATVLAKAGLNVVSGLAYGIDAEAHKATLAAGGVTTAVLGHGLGRIYPHAHTALAQRIEMGGAVITEYRHTVKPEANNFPERNRIIAGLCKAVVVIEAGPTGGALITARLGFEMNREVFAMPGSIESKTSMGCHALVQKNIARLVTDPEEVLQELKLGLGDNGPKQISLLEPPPNLTADEARVYEQLNTDGRLLDELGALTALPVAQLITILLDLEFRGLVRQLPGRKFVRL
jgi:DNA processing protein